MDPLEIFNDTCVDESECQSALPEVDIDLLVNADFNRAVLGSANQDVQFRTTVDDELCPNHDLSTEQTLLDLNAIQEFSPRRTHEDRQIQLDKKPLPTYLTDSKGEDLARIVNQNDQTCNLSFPSSSFCDEITIKQGITTTQTANNFEHDMCTPPSVVTQSEWHSLPWHAPKSALDPIPPSMVEEVKMISLDQESTDTHQNLLELPLGGTQHEIDDLNLALPSDTGPSNLTLTSLPLRQRSSIHFQLPLAAPRTISYTEDHSLKAAKVPMKHSRKRSSKVRKGTPSSSQETQRGEAEFASSSNLTKKATGRRKVCHSGKFFAAISSMESRYNSDQFVILSTAPFNDDTT